MPRHSDPRPRGGPRAARPTEREQRLLRQVAVLARRLLSASPERLDHEIQDCLGEVAGVAGADRCFLSVFGRRGSPPASYEWVRPGLESHLPEPDPDAAARYPWSAARVEAGEAIVCRDPAQLPDAADSERKQMVARGVRSLLTLPIRPGERVIGYQIFECFQAPRDWSEPEVALLRVVTEIFASSVIARRTEAALRTSERRFRAMAENAPQLVAEVGADGETLYVTPRIVELLGWRPQEVVGRPATSLFHPDDLEGVAELEAALRRGEVARVEVRVRHADGSWRWFDATAQTYVSQDGEPRVVVVADDSTERRILREALRESQAQLFQAQKMEAVGRLAGGIAHDFNNLLLVIGGNVQEALDDPGLPPGVRDAVREAMAGVDRAASLTRQLLSFSRRDLQDPRAVDLNEVVGSMEGLLGRLVGEHIRVHVDLAPEPAVVRNDRGQLEQVLVNLAVNARDAMPEGGELFLATERREIDDEGARTLGLARPGPHHVLVVRDTGQGVDPSSADHIFEPFYTTKEPGSGTGLGLSIVYSVAHQAGGTVRLLTPTQPGATFEVILPAADVEVAEAAGAATAAPGAMRARLLLVEDEPAVRRLLVRMLERHGYDVTVAEDGERALAWAERADEPVDLLVTDVVMPTLTGPELARRLRARWPGLAVLFVSGYPREFRPGSDASDDAFLSKPFTQEQLLQAVGEQLERGRGGDGEGA